MTETLCFGAHIPKCAGTTLLNRVQSCLHTGEIYQTTSTIDNFRRGQLEFLHRANKDRWRFVWGHAVHEEMLKYFDRPVCLITGLRHPIERLASHFRHDVSLAVQQGRTPPTPEQFIALHRSDEICWFLISRFPTLAGSQGKDVDRAFRVLEWFDIVYLTDTFETAAAQVFDVLGIKPAPVNHNVASKDDTEPFTVAPERVRKDLELYERAQAAFGARTAPANRDGERKRLLGNTPNDERLANFLYRALYIEYLSWNVLDTVIDQRLALAREIERELRTYYALRSEQG